MRQGPGGAPPRYPHRSMRIATWNLERPTPRQVRRRARLDQWLTEIYADVWVLTETHDCVSPGDAFACVCTEETDRPGEPGERWTAIWSRHPIERVPLSNDPARCVAALVRPPHRVPLVVYGTVLPWRGSTWRGTTSKGAAAFKAALEGQLADWLKLRQMFPDAVLCVAGDFNQDLSDRHYYWSLEAKAALRQALATAGLVCTTADPHDPVRARAPERASIDHVCVTEGTFANHVVWPAGDSPTKSVSDHFGVAVDVTVPFGA